MLKKASGKPGGNKWLMHHVFGTPDENYAAD